MASTEPVESSDSQATPRATKNKRRNTQPIRTLTLEPTSTLEELDANTLATCLSPPPTPKRPTHRPRLSLRLRSNSGLALHTNQAAFRQYTDYGSDGTLRSPALPMSPRAYTDFISSTETTPESSRSSIAFFEDLATNPYSPPGLDFFHRDVVQMVLHNPATAQRLCKFAQSRTRGADMEFLVKIDEYSRAVSNMASLISHISTSFTSVTALLPLGLPSEVSTALNSNLKNFNKQMLPTLERLFKDAKVAVEKRVTNEIYPEFVKYQLVQCVKSSLSVSKVLIKEFQTAYPGLGDTFVLTDPVNKDNPVVYCSDGFSTLTGYPRNEVLQQNCRFLQGLETDRKAGQCIRESVSLGRETTQLMLNYRKDGTAFWNLVFICPLQEQGRVNFCLGGQINVSENIGSHYKDILRILDFGLLPGETAAEREKDNTSRERTPRKSSDRRVERVPSARVRDERRRSQRSRFFKPFSRKLAGATAMPGEGASKSANHEDAVLPKVPGSAHSSETSTRSFIPEPISPYPHLIVMRYVPGATRSPNVERRGSVPAPILPLVFCSTAALELFGLEPCDAEYVLDQDIFNILADYGSSPTISKAVKANIRDKLTAGESTALDLFISAEPNARQFSRRGRKNSIMSLSSRSRDTTVSSANESDSSLARGRKSETLERSAELVSSVLFGPKMRKLISHWTPLKDAQEVVHWAVLVMTPASG